MDKVIETVKSVNTGSERANFCIELLKKRINGEETQKDSEMVCKGLIIEDTKSKVKDEKGKEVYRDYSAEINEIKQRIIYNIIEIRELQRKKKDNKEDNTLRETAISKYKEKIEKLNRELSSSIAQQISNEYWKGFVNEI